ncbi:MAG: hypothetical protein K9L60_02335 [Methylovulum sp.]|nr:hypothetical protein [Methylovulum sp.]MCF7997961.1 hypothetical protein [Methylovulum sp.]
MNPDKVSRLYSQLTPHELAALGFEAIQRRDYVEGEMIANALNKQSRDYWHYRARVFGLTSLALFFGGMYWKTVACTPRDGTDSMNYSHIASMDAALLEVCKQCKVSVEAIRTLGQCAGQYTLDKDLFVKPDLVDYYLGLFLPLI